MATRLLAAHHDVVVYNRTPERTRPLEQGGAKVAVTAKQLAAGVDIVFSSVTAARGRRRHRVLERH